MFHRKIFSFLGVRKTFTYLFFVSTVEPQLCPKMKTSQIIGNNQGRIVPQNSAIQNFGNNQAGIVPQNNSSSNFR